MNDYNRSINLDNPRLGVWLNGDTAVRSYLNRRANIDDLPISRLYFDITEDGSLDYQCEDSLADYPHLMGPDDVHLLHRPLPQDLPEVNKDILIMMAAYEDNIDRYVRLRRPKFVDHEEGCIIRGIYHHTSFARWWADELDSHPNRYHFDFDLYAAANARFIMVNELSRITKEPTNSHMPYVIWYPLWPEEVTLRELLLRKPGMRQQVAHACIVCNYQGSNHYHFASGPWDHNMGDE
jgi:hypothetical protein